MNYQGDNFYENESIGVLNEEVKVTPEKSLRQGVTSEGRDGEVG